MFNLVQRRRLYFSISAVLIGLGILFMVISTIRTGSPFQLGVDFRSGTRFEIQFEAPVNEDQIRRVFNQHGVNNPAVISLRGEGLENTWQVRSEFVRPDRAQAIIDTLSAEVVPVNADATQVDSVSPAVGAEVSRAAFAAVIVAAVVILVYIMFAFRQVPNPFRYGACAVAAMVHDLLMIFGFIAITGMLLGWEVDALFLTAALTVAGFSLQDTIVVFDRVRENIARRPSEAYEVVVNRSVLETVHRSLATQLAAMFILVALLFFGGASIRQFIAVLFVGVLSGTYSSIFTAVPLLVAWEQGEIPFLKPAPSY